MIDSMAVPSHVIVHARCASCDGGVELECKGLQGFWGYRTFNEYFCPHCRKQNHVLSTGAVVAVRATLPGDNAPRATR